MRPQHSDVLRTLGGEPPLRAEIDVRAVATRLFPVWQAFLVGLPLALIIGSILGVMVGLVVAMSLTEIVGPPRPEWMGTLSEVLLYAVMAATCAGVFAVMRRRRAQFFSLARNGIVVPTVDVDGKGLSQALGNEAAQAAARLALGAAGGTLALMYGGPIVGGQVGDELLEVRVPADSKGRFPRPQHMLVQSGNSYVALIGPDWIKPQKISRRRKQPPPLELAAQSPERRSTASLIHADEPPSVRL
jgi:hypothetical protein